MKHTHHIEVTLKQLRVTTTIKLDARVLDDACVALDRVAAGQQRSAVGPWQVVLGGRFVRVAAVLALIAAVVAVAVVLWVRGAEDTRPIARPPRPRETPNVPPERPGVQRQLADEKAQIETMFAAGDIDGLVAVLAAGLPESKRLAATYLGQIGDARAIPALSQLAAQWSGRPDENPYRQAIGQINARIQPPEPNAPDPNQVSQGQVSPEPRQAPVLSGTITDRDTGLPIPDVLVRVSLSPIGRGYETSTDSNGLYVLEAVDSDGDYDLVLTAPEHITQSQWEKPEHTFRFRRAVWERPQATLHLSHNKPTIKDYTLARGAEILATVVDEAGLPVSDAWVYASYIADNTGRGPKRPTRPDANGIASIGGLRADRYMVIAASERHAPARQSVTLEEPGQVQPVVFVMEKGMEVVGTATCSDGLAPGGWRIEVKPAWWRSLYPRRGDYVIGDDGAFTLAHVLPGACQVDVYRPLKAGSRRMWTTEVNLPPEGGLLDLRIPKLSPHSYVSISGMVAFTGGQPEQGVGIYARNDAGHSGRVQLGPGEPEFILSDLVPGLYSISVNAAGTRKEFKNIKAPSEGIVLEIALPQPAAPLRASVVDGQTHLPIARFQYRVAGDLQWRRIDDPNGAFTAPARSPDALKVTIRASGYGDAVAELSPDAAEPTVIEMRASPVLTGTVVDQAGRPVEGVTVSYRYRRGVDDSPQSTYITSTDAEGRFFVDDAAADDMYHWYVFRHPEFARTMRYIKTPKGAPTEMDIVLHEGGAIEGYVYDWQGRPLIQTPIYLLDVNSFWSWKENLGRLGQVRTDDTGYYRIEHLPEELCYAFLNDPDDQLGVVVSAILPQAGRTRRLDLGGLWKTTGRLFAAGEPVADVRLLVTVEAGMSQAFRAYAHSDASGRFTFWGIPTGQRSIYSAVPGDRDGKLWVRLNTLDFAAGVDLDLGDLEVMVTEIAVELVAADPGATLDSWEVSLHECSEKFLSGRRVGRPQLRSDHLDPFVFSGVGPGRYEAIARREGYPSVRQTLEIAPGQSDGAVALTIPSTSCALSGAVEPAPSRRGSLLITFWSRDQRITAQSHLDADGRFTVKNLPPGEYVIGRAAKTVTRTSALTTVNLQPGQHKDIRIQVDRTEEDLLVVLLVTEAGHPLATPDVWLERGEQIVRPHRSTDDGKWFAGPPGTYTLRADCEGHESVHQTVAIQSGQGRTKPEIRKPLVVTMRRR